MKKSNKTRIQVALSDQVIALIDKYCEIAGMTRSAYCASVISQSIVTTQNFVDTVSDSFAKTVKEGEAK